MTMLSPLPVPTPEQAALGRHFFNTLGRTIHSCRDWFAEGVPGEWLRALEMIQKVLTECKRQASDANHNDSAAESDSLPLFALFSDQKGYQ